MLPSEIQLTRRVSHDQVLSDLWVQVLGDEPRTRADIADGRESTLDVLREREEISLGAHWRVSEHCAKLWTRA